MKAACSPSDLRHRGAPASQHGKQARRSGFVVTTMPEKMEVFCNENTPSRFGKQPARSCTKTLQTQLWRYVGRRACEARPTADCDAHRGSATACGWHAEISKRHRWRSREGQVCGGAMKKFLALCLLKRNISRLVFYFLALYLGRERPTHQEATTSCLVNQL